MLPPEAEFEEKVQLMKVGEDEELYTPAPLEAEFEEKVQLVKVGEEV